MIQSDTEQGASGLLSPDSEQVAKMDIAHERREFLYRNVPCCPECGDEQVQIMDTVDQPAKWQCRYCRFGFDFEPEQPSNEYVRDNGQFGVGA